MAKKKGIYDFMEMKSKGDRITFLTADDYPTGVFAEKAGMDMLLVGDSLGMVVYGYDGTIPVTMEESLIHTRAVRRGAAKTFVVGDMPFMSYQESVEKAIHNAGRFYKEAGVDAIKLEGGRRVAGQIRGIVDSGMLVMGHIGLTPQSSGQMGGFKAQGMTAESGRNLVEDAKALEEAGVFAILVEAIPPEVAKAIRERTNLPVLGIGAGGDCDGQLLIVGDMLGFFEAFTPKFVKKYANLSEDITKAFAEYVDDVKQGRFPEESHTYRMTPEEKKKFLAAIK